MLLGAVIGDMVGSRFEPDGIGYTDFELFTAASHFTDDTVCTVAVADWVARGCGSDLAVLMQQWCRRYPDRAYGKRFGAWIHQTPPQPYQSWGNGSAMRVSAVGWAFETLDETLTAARRSAEITHNHPEAVNGAQAVAAAIFWARNGCGKTQILETVEQQFGCTLPESCAAARASGRGFSDRCFDTLPLALAAFAESRDFVEAVRLAVLLGSDSDTLAAIAGSIAEAFYREIPDEICRAALLRLPEEMQTVLAQFQTA